MKNLLVKGIALCVFMMVGSAQADAQLNNILNKVASAVSTVTGNKTTASESTVVGTWKYTGPAVSFSSDNVLSNLGGSVASSKIEKKLNTYLTKVGLSSGKFTLALNEDKSFTATLSNGKKSTGTYTVSDSKLVLTFATTGAKVTATPTFSGSDLQLMMTADKLLSLAKAVTKSASSAKSSLSTLSTLLSQYSGMQVGLKFSK